MAGGTKLDLQRRQHRERGQPLHRKRLGLLEKHRDYVARARDYHGKQDRIRSLKRKASERNPDELYFGMVRPDQGALGDRLGLLARPVARRSLLLGFASLN